MTITLNVADHCVVERPETSEYAPFYEGYINRVQDPYLLRTLKESFPATQSLLSNLTDEQTLFRYAEGKWNIREIVLHLSDAERIFCYRALRFARNDATPLPGFDENAYTPCSGASERSMASILEEFATVRAATLALFQNFTPAMLRAVGTLNHKPMSVRALGYVIAGHEIHHRTVIQERYLKA